MRLKQCIVGRLGRGILAIVTARDGFDYKAALGLLALDLAVPYRDGHLLPAHRVCDQFLPLRRRQHFRLNAVLVRLQQHCNLVLGQPAMERHGELRRLVIVGLDDAIGEQQGFPRRIVADALAVIVLEEHVIQRRRDLLGKLDVAFLDRLGFSELVRRQIHAHKLRHDPAHRIGHVAAYDLRAVGLGRDIAVHAAEEVIEGLGTRAFLAFVAVVIVRRANLLGEDGADLGIGQCWHQFGLGSGWNVCSFALADK